MHEVKPHQRGTLKVHPQGKRDLPLIGVFATRSPSRPNPLGITIVRLLERRGNVLKVVGLDALNGTPVVDLKPFPAGQEIAGEIRVPPWVNEL